MWRAYVHRLAPLLELLHRLPLQPPHRGQEHPKRGKELPPRRLHEVLLLRQKVRAQQLLQHLRLLEPHPIQPLLKGEPLPSREQKPKVQRRVRKLVLGRWPLQC